MPRAIPTIFCVAMLSMTIGVSRGQQPDVAPQVTLSRSALSLKIEQKIRGGVRYLYSRQNGDGSWGDGFTTDPAGGNTALVTLALLSCGESHQTPAIQKAITYLKTAKPQDAAHSTYSIALRACVWASLPDAIGKAPLAADMKWLQSAIITKGESKGMYDYGAALGMGGDFSNTQYGVLGVWYASLAGLEVPRTYWSLAEEGWREGQNPDGGWGYSRNQRRSYASMTAAGAATLFITNDHLHAADAQDLTRKSQNPALEKAVQWLGDHFAVDQNTGLDTSLIRAGNNPVLDVLGDLGRPPGTYIQYMLFAYERVGEASGLTRFGTHAWFDEGAEHLVSSQESMGNWRGTNGPEIDTAYAVLFLSRGRAPVVMQKLQFGEAWNNRPRDVAGFTLFMRRATELHVNWQILPADADASRFRDAPLLYLASHRSVTLNDELKTRIKTYLDQGGLLVCEAEGLGKPFIDSVTAMAKEMYPDYAFRDLPASHPVYTANFPAVQTTEMIRGLSNGVRELIILYPRGDMSWKWHSTGGGFLPQKSPYASLANLWLYVTDRANPRFKGEDTWIDANPAVITTRKAEIVRIEYPGNWNPEPAGWARLANVMHNFDQLDLAVQPSREPSAGAMMHLTGTESFTLPATSKAAIKKSLDAGGLLFCDSAGGSSITADTFEKLLRELYPNITLAPLPLDHPVYRAARFGGQTIEAVTYRPSPNLRNTSIPRLRGATVGGKLVAIVSNEDLSAGLVGYSTAGVNGYSPQSAIDLMRNILLWRAAGRN